MEVSIHAPREGCDKTQRRQAVRTRRFNSRTPGGVRPLRLKRLRYMQPFQFTHPGRGATRQSLGIRPNHSRFNSRTPGGVRL